MLFIPPSDQPVTQKEKKLPAEKKEARPCSLIFFFVLVMCITGVSADGLIGASASQSSDKLGNFAGSISQIRGIDQL